MTKCNNIHPRQDATFKSLDYLVPYYPQVYLCLNLSRVTFLIQTVWYNFTVRTGLGPDIVRRTGNTKGFGYSFKILVR